MHYYLAIDLGASSGRHIIGWKNSDGTIMTEEIYRFQNAIIISNGDFTWDLEKLYEEILVGIKLAFNKYPDIISLAIDTWGVDYVLLAGDRVIQPTYAYRSSRTRNAIKEVHQLIPFEQLYQISGCQFQPFNTIYQLFDDLKKRRLGQATDLLMLPEYFMYLLTGNKVKEYTNASTTGLLDLASGKYSDQIINSLGFPKHLFADLKRPGYQVGELLPSIVKRVGGQTKVVLCATHDTASAVESIDIKPKQIYLSSGTWSLVGVRLNQPITNESARDANFSNECGPNYIRFQKNIMGLWMLQSLAKDTNVAIHTLIEQAQTSKLCEIIDINDQCFLAPANMFKAVISSLKSIPDTDRILPGDIANVIMHSLAHAYNQTIQEISCITNQKYEQVIIIGGGANNDYLNELTRKYTGLEVIVRPIEATAIGNIRNQMEGKHHEN